MPVQSEPFQPFDDRMSDYMSLTPFLLTLERMQTHIEPTAREWGKNDITFMVTISYLHCSVILSVIKGPCSKDAKPCCFPTYYYSVPSDQLNLSCQVFCPLAGMSKPKLI